MQYNQPNIKCAIHLHEQEHLTNQLLKPATVEVFFRDTNRADQTTELIADKLDRKPIASAVFPQPKIGLKS